MMNANTIYSRTNESGKAFFADLMEKRRVVRDEKVELSMLRNAQTRDVLISMASVRH